MKEQYNKAYEDVCTDGGNSRFMHAWYEDDGIFCIKVEDFLKYFTQIVVVRDFAEQTFGVEYES